jgi:hypothetical protein
LGTSFWLCSFFPLSFSFHVSHYTPFVSSFHFFVWYILRPCFSRENEYTPVHIFSMGDDHHDDSNVLDWIAKRHQHQRLFAITSDTCRTVLMTSAFLPGGSVIFYSISSLSMLSTFALDNAWIGFISTRSYVCVFGILAWNGMVAKARVIEYLERWLTSLAFGRPSYYCVSVRYNPSLWSPQWAMKLRCFMRQPLPAVSPRSSSRRCQDES